MFGADLSQSLEIEIFNVRFPAEANISDLECNGGRITQIGDPPGMKLDEFNSHETCEGLLFYTNSPRLKPFGATRLSKVAQRHRAVLRKVHVLINKEHVLVADPRI